MEEVSRAVDIIAIVSFFWTKYLEPRLGGSCCKEYQILLEPLPHICLVHILSVIALPAVCAKPGETYHFGMKLV